ncbi:hypothetical protein [Burkholderia gladioli]|uniref:hypothetical protein n=1 Tax=Burkholderia gladioli TaxID=28095 RepID=UPI00163E6B0C|nr:hypothetical protein [Burkholderia gladioli]
MALTLCEHCLTFSGIYRKQNWCCRVRQIANMPKAMRDRAYADHRAVHGEAAARTLRDDVQAEYRRWKAYKEANKNIEKLI